MAMVLRAVTSSRVGNTTQKCCWKNDILHCTWFSRLCIFASLFSFLTLFSLWSGHIKSAKEWIAQRLAAIALKFAYTHTEIRWESKTKERNTSMGVSEKEIQMKRVRRGASARRNSNFMFPFFERNIITENKRKYYKLEINLLQRLFWWHHKMKEKWKNKVFVLSNGNNNTISGSSVMEAWQ